ncbi:hypothetical protein Syn7803C53_9 [Synechococcus phage ACG-2014a]|uniref:Uncharacterized protein n=1 Tax=Synechococcus phage ACG-2014a TaxID=1493507 RepID=A0A0E3EQ82_9CAUD|nr:hypothetical protein Syn7803C53_9 [Synechococcus phage ACG-2014a]
MAKLQAYKFVNPGGTTRSPVSLAVNKNVLGINRLGSTVSSLGSVISDIEKINIASIKNDKKQELLERRRKQRERDESAEEAQELTKLEKGKSKIKPNTKQKKAAGGSLGFISKFLNPIGQFLLSIGGLVAVNTLLDWVSDKENFDKVKEFLRKTQFVFDKLFGFFKAVGDATFNTFKTLFGSDSSFGDRLKALGTILLGIIALKGVMNPFGLMTDILGLLDLFTGDGGGRNPNPDPNADKSKSKNKPDNKTKPKSGTDPERARNISRPSASSTPVKPQTKFTGIEDTDLRSPQRRLADKISKKHGAGARSAFDQRYNDLISSGSSPAQATRRANADVLKRIDKKQITSRPALGNLSARSNRMTATILGATSDDAAKLGTSKIFKKGVDKATQRFLLKIIGMGGVKALKKILNRIPIIGPLITFALNWASGESIAASAAMAVGAGLGELLGGWLGGAAGLALSGFSGGLLAPVAVPIGGFIGAMLGGIAGEALGGWLFKTITGEGGGSGGMGAVGSTIAEGLKQLLTKEFWDKIGTGIAGVWSNIVAAAGKLWNMLSGMAEFLNIPSFFDTLWKKMGKMAGTLYDVFSILMNPLRILELRKVPGMLLSFAKDFGEFFIMPGPIGFIWKHGVEPFFSKLGDLWNNRDKLWDFMMKPGTFQDTFNTGKYDPKKTSPTEIKKAEETQKGMAHMRGGPVLNFAFGGPIQQLASGGPIQQLASGGVVNDIGQSFVQPESPSIGADTGDISFKFMNVSPNLNETIVKSVRNVITVNPISNVTNVNNTFRTTKNNRATPPKMVSPVNSSRNMLSATNGFSAQYAMDQGAEFIPIPIVIERVVPIPQAVPINTGKETVQITQSSLSQRMK